MISHLGVAGFKKHVIPAPMCAVAWDLCFMKPSYKVITALPHLP